MDQARDAISTVADSVDRYTNLDRTKAEPTVLRPAIHQLATALKAAYDASLDFRDTTLKPQLEALKAEETSSKVIEYIEKRPEALCYSTATIGALSGLKGGPRRMLFRGILGGALGFAGLMSL